ncbi:MAG: YceD family protein [Deltaproteobacteria bacterium]
MHFDIGRLSEGKETVLEEEWDAASFDLNAPSWRFTGAVRVTARARRDAAIARVALEVSAPLSAVCGRCGRVFDVAYRHAAELIYPAEAGAVVLDEDIRSEILLAFPQQVLCSDACRGLCPRCGADLNREKCTCAVVP